MQVGISLVMDGSWEFHLFGLVVENDLLRLLYLPIKAFATAILKFQQQYVINKFHNKYDCLHWWHSWDQKTSSNESDACIYDWVCKQLFFDPLYLHYPNHCIKLDDVRTRNRNVLWIMSYVHPRGIEILGCCPAGPVLHHGAKLPL